MSVRFAIGIGARGGVDAEEIVALVRRAAAQAGVEIRHSVRTLGRSPSPPLRGEGRGEGPGAPAAMSVERMASGQRETTYALFTIDTKRGEAGFHGAAHLLGTKIFFLPIVALEARKDDVLTRSAVVERRIGVGSVAETAALAGAGLGSRLLAPRLAMHRATCAIARACANATSEAP